MERSFYVNLHLFDPVKKITFPERAMVTELWPVLSVALKLSDFRSHLMRQQDQWMNPRGFLT